MKEGDLVRQYRIGPKLGQGGMGVVYQGHDTRLDRTVALKFLPATWTDDEESKVRFMQEARAASGLDHPNIYTIYEIGETDDGELFIVTPYYDGQTLKYLLKDGALPIADAVDIASQLLRGLRRAHEAGIIHRDVKPANIMVTGHGVVKLLDFGLAKLEAGVFLTKTGSTLGTSAYMSPEQASGKGVDNRSDLWSVGVVLYEMLNGGRPFTGDYEQSIIYSVINEDPPKLEASVPTEYSAIVRKLLSKDPDARFATATEVLEQLTGDDSGSGRTATQSPAEPSRTRGMARPWMIVPVLLFAAAIGYWMLSGNSATETSPPGAESTTSVEKPRSAIAIMPFSSLRSDPETDFLGFALADQIIGSLTYVSELLVRPSSSIRPYVEQQYDTKTAGRDLAVDYILNGTYLKQGDQMRLTIELVDVASDEIIWREPVELEYRNAFELQDAVSQTVLSRLEVEFSADEQQRMSANSAVDPVAYEFYLRGVAQPTTTDGNAVAEQMLRKSISIDSMFAPAWDQLGFRLARIGQFSLAGEGPTIQAERAFLRALDLNPELFSGLSNLSSLYTDLGRTLEAIQMADRMLEINANSALGHFARGYALRYVGMTDESVSEMRKAIQLDSTDSRFRSAGVTFLEAGLYNEAIRAVGLDRASAYADHFGGEALVRDGKTDRALERFENAIRKDPNGLMGMAALSTRAALIGDFAEGLASARRWESAGVVDAEAAFYNGAMYCLNKDVESCLRTLELAVDRGYVNVDAMQNQRYFDLIQDDPRLQSIIELARQKQAAFVAGYRK